MLVVEGARETLPSLGCSSSSCLISQRLGLRQREAWRKRRPCHNAIAEQNCWMYGSEDVAYIASVSSDSISNRLMCRFTIVLVLSTRVGDRSCHVDSKGLDVGTLPGCGYRFCLLLLTMELKT